MSGNLFLLPFCYFLFLASQTPFCVPLSISPFFLTFGARGCNTLVTSTAKLHYLDSQLKTLDDHTVFYMQAYWKGSELSKFWFGMTNFFRFDCTYFVHVCNAMYGTVQQDMERGMKHAKGIQYLFLRPHSLLLSSSSYGLYFLAQEKVGWGGGWMAAMVSPVRGNNNRHCNNKQQENNKHVLFSHYLRCICTD